MNNKAIKRKKKTIFRFSFLTLIFTILIVLISLTIYVNTIIFSKEVDQSLTYNENGSLDYSVCLNQNDYINDECINEKRSFVTTLINNIKLNLNYGLDASNLIDYNYNYSIKVKAVATEKGESNKVLYTKEETLKEGTDSGKDSNFIVINENIELDYQKFNNIITSFKKNYVLAVDSELIVTAVINVTGVKEGINQEINNSYTMSVSMPLAEQTVNITDTDDTIAHSDHIIQYKDKSDRFNRYKIYSIILYVIDAIYLIFLMGLFTTLFPRKRSYDRKISKILKSYDELIVTVNQLPDIRKLAIIEVGEFTELLDAREALNKPILFFRSVHNDYCVFMIREEEEAYIYIINAYEKVKHVKI